MAISCSHGSMPAQVPRASVPPARRPAPELPVRPAFARRESAPHVGAAELRALIDTVAAERRRAGAGPTVGLARALVDVGNAYLVNGDEEDAQTAFDEAVVAYRALYRHIDRAELAAASEGAAQAHSARGDYSGACRLFIIARQMFRRLHPDADHPDVAESLANLGNFYCERGEYAKAERPLFEAVAMYRRMNSAGDAPGLATCLGFAAEYFRERGEPDSARMYGEMSVTTWRRLSAGADNHRLAASMRALGAMLEEAGDTVGALRQDTSALSMLRRLYGDAPQFDLAAAVGTVGRIYAERGDVRNALPMLEESREMYGRLCRGADHPGSADALCSIALCRGINGHPEAADSTLATASAMYHRLFARLDHADLAIRMSRVARVADKLALHARADTTYEEVRRLLALAARESSLFEGEGRQMHFRMRLAGAWNSLLEYSWRHEHRGELFNAALAFKGRVLAALQWRSRVLAELDGRVGEPLELWRRYQDARAWLSDTRSGMHARRFDEWRRDRLAATARFERIEDSLARFSATFGASRKRPTWLTVQRALHGGEGVVEYVRIPQVTGDAFYCALVLGPGRAQPEMVRLCDERQLRDILRSPVADAEVTSYIHDAGHARTLYRLLWQPVDAMMTKTRRVFICPDGLLNGAAFHVLADTDGHRLMDRFSLHYLFGSVDLLPASDVRAAAPPRQRAAIFGNPRFDADSDAIVRELVRLAVRPDSILSDNETDGDLPRDPGIGMPLLPLTSTAAEADSVAAILDRHAYRVTMRTGLQATEEAFMRLEWPTILHVATHGFFFSNPASTDTGLQCRQFPGGVRAIQYSDDPLMRSGLLFAGADRVWMLHQPAARIDDGIVTAFDIARMNLTGAELVVLSACETGLGDIAAGEGVMGLKRAFRAAGAKAVMMSLWSVPDRQTRQLMELFYRNWLDEGMGKAEALAAAQREMAREYDDPYYWGAFVLVGE